MLFYKAEGMLKGYEEQENRRVIRERIRKIFLKTEKFNQGHSDRFCFVSGTNEDLMTVGMITDRSENAENILCSFLDFIGCPMQDMTVEETTIYNISNLLARASHNDYIADDDEIKGKYGLDRVNGRSGRLVYGENLVKPGNREHSFAQVKKYLMNETFTPELERIYAGTPSNRPQGHPVHYIIQTDDQETRRESYRLLVQTLCDNGRLDSRRYAFLDFRPGESFPVISLEALYQVCAGGAMVVRYQANDDSEDNGFASAEWDTIESICSVAKQFANRVLTVICLPRECKKAKSIFYENLGGMTFVELREDFVDGEQAQDFLKMLANEHHIRTDKALFSAMEPGKTYLAVELRQLFDRWYGKKLKTKVYPQYKDLQVARQEVVKAAPKGSAYDDLQEMIGLTEAKKVIQKALNYYKMQKLYEEKGMKRDNPAMHMVFTGNPGTAKTTAARLFAGIMKENGLLSKGHLVEVGRGDLVGKYVGWTAPTVQAKFKAAKGGVLFIDEAYSLVDGHTGSYGDEAINTIVQEMENHREDVVVIFAGYPKEMETFLQKNPGLRSRIAFHVPFADYNTEELCRIAVLMGKRKGVSFDPEAQQKLAQVFDVARQQSDFGNGRYVRNLLEQAKMNQASRLLDGDFDSITAEELTTLRAADILVPEQKTPEKRIIGFAC